MLRRDEQLKARPSWQIDQTTLLVAGLGLAISANAFECGDFRFPKTVRGLLPNMGDRSLTKHRLSDLIDTYLATLGVELASPLPRPLCYVGNGS